MIRTDRLLKLLKKNYKILLVLGVTLLLLCMELVISYKDIVIPAQQSRERYVSCLIDNKTKVMEKGEVITQEIRMVSDSIEAIALAFDTREGMGTTKLEVQLVDPDDKNVLYTWEYDTAQAISGGYNVLEASEVIPVTKGKIYTLLLTPFDEGGVATEIYMSRLDMTQGTDFIDDVNNTASVAYQLLGPADGRVKNVWLAWSVGLLGFLCIGGLVIMKKRKLEYTFSILAFALGILYMFAIPPYSVADEEAHFSTVYEKSSRLLGAAVTNENDVVIARGEEFSYYVRSRNATRESYEDYMYGVLGKTDTTVTGEILLRTPLDSASIAYAPQILGVTLARVLHLNGEQLLLLGRLFGLLFYVCMVALSIKIIPFAKNMLFVVGLLPMSIQQAMSYSYDMMINALSILMIAYFLHLIYKKEHIQKRDIAYLSLLSIVIMPIKVIYIVILGMGILIPGKKFQKAWHKWTSAGVLLAIGGGAVIVNNLTKVFEMVAKPTGAVIYGVNEPGYSVQYFLEEPLQLIEVFYKTFRDVSQDYVLTLIGSGLGWLDIGLNFLIIIGFIILLLLSCLKEEREPYYFGKRDKLWLGFIGCATSFMVLFALLIDHTKLGAEVVEGVQGRYFLPILPIMLLLLRNNIVVLKSNIERFLSAGMVVLHVWTLTSIIRTIMFR